MGVDGWSQLQIRNAEQKVDQLRDALREVLAAYDRFVEDRNLYALSVHCDKYSTPRKVLNDRVPSETPLCAGRAAVAHTPAAMRRVCDGWTCPVCGEFWLSDRAISAQGETG